MKDMAGKLISLWKRVPASFGLGRHLKVHLSADSPNIGIVYHSIAAEKVLRLLGPALGKTALLKDDQVAILKEGSILLSSEDISSTLPKDAGLAAEGGHTGTGWLILGILPTVKEGQFAPMVCEHQRIYIDMEAEFFHILDLLLAIPAGSSPEDVTAQEHLKSAMELSIYRPWGPRCLRVVDLPEGMPENKLWYANLRALFAFAEHWPKRCSGCQNTDSAVAKPLRHCTKCGAAHYCSKACQVCFSFFSCRSPFIRWS